MKTVCMLILSLAVFAACFYIGYIIVAPNSIQETDPQKAMLIGVVFGAFSGQYGQVVSYWFGSSKGSSEKDETIIDNSKTISDLTKTQTPKEVPNA